jgi:hypothetical protein
MGLILAKHYNEKFDTKKNDDSINLYYGESVEKLDVGKRFFYPEDDVIELFYKNNDNLELSYDSEHRVVISTADSMVHFMIISPEGGSGGIKRSMLNYPWLPQFNGIRISKFTEDEYLSTRDEVLTRLMYFRE